MVALVFDATKVAPNVTMGVAPPSTPQSIAGFFEELLEFGIIAKVEAPTDGKIVRADVFGDKKGSKNGWYILFDDGMICGAYGSWKTGEKHTWSAVSKNEMAPADQEFYKIKMEEAKARRDEEQQQTWTMAAHKAYSVMTQAAPAGAAHPYLVSKGISPHGVFQDGDDLLVPIMDIHGGTQSLQTITPKGIKRFLFGGRISGGIYVLGIIKNHVYVTEGFSTGATIMETMGPDCAVVIAFNAGNLVPVVSALCEKHPTLEITIAADNDHWTEGNPGVTKANEASNANVGRCKVRVPYFNDVSTKPTDFNDLMRLEGTKPVSDFLKGGNDAPLYKPKDTDLKTAQPPDITNPPGILKDIVEYYAMTARKHTPVFAIQTALAIGSIVAARRYRTTKSNYTSLYFLNIGKSGEGKEHAKDMISRVLHAAGIGQLYKSKGYASAGAIYSRLLEEPAHLAAWDEFGRDLQSNKHSPGGHKDDVMTTLMEAFGNLHGVMDPPSYSTMTLTAAQKKGRNQKSIHNPAISILAMSQPHTFFSALSGSNISDGFLGRLLYVESDEERRVGVEPDYEEVPRGIVDWIESVRRDIGVGNLVDITDDMPDLQPPDPMILTFTPQALILIRKFEEEIIAIQKDLDKSNMAELLGRTKEKAMRVSIIVALAIKPTAEVITSGDIQWAIDYVRWCDFGLVERTKKLISGSVFEAVKKAFLFAIRERGAEGITVKEMIKTPPFSLSIVREKDEAISELEKAGLIQLQVIRSGKPGRPSHAYVAINSEGRG